MIEYTLIRSQRKTLSLTVTKELVVEVRAPLRMATDRIHRFVQEQAGWIGKQRARLEPEARRRTAFTYQDGQTFPFQGREVALATGSGSPRLAGDTLSLREGEDRPGAVAGFLREECRRMVTERIQVFAPLLGVVPTGVKITSATTRWGSCSGRNSLCFSYRVACLPPELLDYIVVHELSHIREHNHSPRFWAVVATQLPHWQELRAALRTAGAEMVL